MAPLMGSFLSPGAITSGTGRALSPISPVPLHSAWHTPPGEIPLSLIYFKNKSKNKKKNLWPSVLLLTPKPSLSRAKRKCYSAHSLRRMLPFVWLTSSNVHFISIKGCLFTS